MKMAMKKKYRIAVYYTLASMILAVVWPFWILSEIGHIIDKTVGVSVQRTAEWLQMKLKVSRYDPD